MLPQRKNDHAVTKEYPRCAIDNFLLTLPISDRYQGRLGVCVLAAKAQAGYCESRKAGHEPRPREKTRGYYLNYIDDHIVPQLGNTSLEKREMKILPEDKIGPYLAEAERRGLLAAFYLELTTGLRRGELLALLWTDLDVENMTISVSKQVNRINGELVVSQPKTPNSIRPSPVLS